MNCNSKYVAVAGAAIVMMAAASAPVAAQTASPVVEQVVTIQNTGKTALTLGARQWPDGFLAGVTPVANHCGSSLAPGGSCQIPVRFVPTHAGQYSGQLVIATSDPETPLISVTLTGIGF